MDTDIALPDRILLVGYRGCGKTTIARQLAGKLAYDWVDADVEVELRAGKSIASIFADDGEQAFRDLESEVLVELCRRERTVLALGGGVVLRAENRQLVSHAGFVVWLQADVETLTSRLAQDTRTPTQRPSLTSLDSRQEIESLLTEREPLYREVASATVATENRIPGEVVDAILELLSERSAK